MSQAVLRKCYPGKVPLTVCYFGTALAAHSVSLGCWVPHWHAVVKTGQGTEDPPEDKFLFLFLFDTLPNIFCFYVSFCTLNASMQLCCLIRSNIVTTVFCSVLMKTMLWGFRYIFISIFLLLFTVVYYLYIANYFLIFVLFAFLHQSA